MAAFIVSGTAFTIVSGVRLIRGALAPLIQGERLFVAADTNGTLAVRYVLGGFLFLL